MIISWRGTPQQIRMDNGPELNSKRLSEWADAKGIGLAYIEPGKPAQNAYIERFNRTFREDVLDAYLFNSLREVARCRSYGSRNTTVFAHTMLWEEYPHISSIQASHDSVYFQLVLKMGSLHFSRTY